MGTATLLWLIGAALGVAGLVVLFWSLRGDRSRGRRRCPKCWYDLSGHESRQCPECGREAKKERHLFQTRRRWRVAALSVILLLIAAGLCFTAEGVRQGWDKVMPSTALIVIASYSDDPWALKTLEARVFRNGDPFDFKKRLSDWQWKWFGWAILRSAQTDRTLAVRQFAYEYLSVAWFDPSKNQNMTALVKSGASDPDPLIRQCTANILGSEMFPDDLSMPLLKSLLDDSSPNIRRSAARALGRVATRNTDAIPDVISALDDQDVGVRASAVDALAEVAGQNACRNQAFDALVRVLNDDPDEHVRGECLTTIAALPCHGGRPRELVLEALGSPNKWMRHIAVLALRQVVDENDILISAALAALNDVDIVVVWSGGQLVWTLPPECLLPHLVELRAARQRFIAAVDRADANGRMMLNQTVARIDKAIGEPRDAK